MPTYEYQCEECGAVFDVFQSIKARPLRKTECPDCQTSRPVKRLISTGGAVIFKGSGFYETDYRSESYKKAAKAETEPVGSSSDSSDKKSGDAKPAESKSGDKADNAATTPKAKASDKPAKKEKSSSKLKATA